MTDLLEHIRLVIPKVLNSVDQLPCWYKGTLNTTTIVQLVASWLLGALNVHFLQAFLKLNRILQNGEVLYLVHVISVCYTVSSQNVLPF